MPQYIYNLKKTTVCLSIYSVWESKEPENEKAIRRDSKSISGFLGIGRQWVGFKEGKKTQQPTEFWSVWFDNFGNYNNWIRDSEKGGESDTTRDK